MDILQSYMHQIQRFDPLTFEQEQALAKRWRDHRDREAFQSLMQSYLRLVVKVALSFRGYGLPLSELVQEGNIGLMQAIARFDPDKGFRLSTYAMWWIRASVQEFILNNWSLVKIGTTSSQKKLFFNLRRLRAQLTEADSEHLSPEAIRIIAQELDVSETDVVNMEQRLGGQEFSLNASMNGGADDSEGSEWQDWLVEERPNQEEVYASQQVSRQRHSKLRDALSMLDDRERAILVARRLTESENTPTLEVLSQHYGISRERVRQLEERAFKKVQAAMATREA